MIIAASAKKVLGQVFNVGSGESHSVNEIANLIIKMMNDKSDRVKYSYSPMNIGDRPGQVFRHTADNSKIRRVLGWRPRINFKEGLDRTIEWYLKNDEWWHDKIWMRHVPIETEEGKTEMH
jgi:dTDP-glucose 4,6-dehydratase